MYGCASIESGQVKEREEKTVSSKKKKVETKKVYCELPKAKTRKQVATGRVGVGAEKQRKVAASKISEQEARKNVRIQNVY